MGNNETKGGIAPDGAIRGDAKVAGIEDDATAAQSRSLWPWVIGFAAVMAVVCGAVAFDAWRATPDARPLTDAEQEHARRESERREQDGRKTELIRDQGYIVPEEDRAQADALVRSLDAVQPAPPAGRKAQEEEEAIEHILREPPQAVVPGNDAQGADGGATGGRTPMFVYSRAFGGARYVDAPKTQDAPPPQTGGASGKPVPPEGGETTSTSPREDDEARLIYSGLPPVTLHEGEMLEAALVNRLVADTEPSPVVCTLSRDLFDRSGRYVVLPAGSRVIGESQVVGYKGASRLFIAFHRIILPNGMSVRLPSGGKAAKALDETGALGVVSKVDRHWFLQFGTSVFFGVLDGISGMAQRNREDSMKSAVLGSTSESFDRILENIMSQYSSVVPTVRVDQGKTLRIYLSDDIVVSPYALAKDRSYHATR